MNKVFVCICIFLLILIIFNIYQVTYTQVKYISLYSNKSDSSEQIKILQLSDLHNKTYLNRNNKLINKIKKLNPDLIVITGDLIDGKTRSLENIFIFLEKLTKINENIYFVLGNHEWRNYNHDNINKALDNIDDSLFTILLSHSPDIIFKEDVNRVDIILSGHTHGGQIRLPGIGAIVAPRQGFFPKYDKGLYQISEYTKLYIDSGLGTSVVPIRLFNGSQMTMITFKGK